MRTGFDPFSFLVLSVAGWLNQRQQHVIEYLVDEYLVDESPLLRKIGARRLLFADDQRRRLAVKAKKLGRKVLAEVATLVTPETLLAWHRKLIAVSAGLKGSHFRRYEGSQHQLGSPVGHTTAKATA